MTHRTAFLPLLAAIAVSSFGAASREEAVHAQEADRAIALVPVEADVLAARRKSLISELGDKGQLMAYLDCGSQLASTDETGVALKWVPGQVYQFQSEAKDVPATQASVAFDVDQVAFDISGLNSKRRYEIGLTWWDYDDGQRTQMVAVGTPNGSNIHLAIPAIRLPNFKNDSQKPDEKRFKLPVSLSRDGHMRLTVQRVTGANVVISELWVVELKSR